MAELLACRRMTGVVGGGTAYQDEVAAHTNASGLAYARTTRPPVEFSAC